LKINGALNDIDKLEEESKKHFVEQNELDLNLATKYYEKDQLEKSRQKFSEIFDRTKNRKDCAHEHLSSLAGMLTFYSPDKQEQTEQILKLSIYGHGLARETKNERFAFYFRGLFLETEYYIILDQFMKNKMFQQIVKAREGNSLMDQTADGLLKLMDFSYYNNLVEISKQYAQNLDNSFKNNEYIIALDLTSRLVYLNLYTYASLVSENTKEKFDSILKNISIINDSCISLAKALNCFGRLCENLKYKAIISYYIGDDKYKDILGSLSTLAAEKQLNYYIRRSEELLETFKDMGPFSENLKIEPTKTNFDETPDEEIDKFHRDLARMAGIDLEKDDKIAGIIKIGIKDRNPERILRNCSHLEIAIGSYGIYGMLLCLPSCGTKLLFCKHANGCLEGLDLDMLYSTLRMNSCVKCNYCNPMPEDWKWTIRWQQDRDENRSEEFRRFLEARNNI